LKAKKNKKQVEKVRHYPRISREKFLSQIGIIMATAPFVTRMLGAFKGRYAFYTRNFELSFPNLPEAFDGIKICHISDLHLGSFGSNREPVDEAFSLINEQNPDLILFTGDMVNNFAAEMQGWESVFTQLKAPMGKFAVLGNHDYGNYSRWLSPEEKEENFVNLIRNYSKLGFTLLRNQSVILSRNGATIGLGGSENWGKVGSVPQFGDLEKTADDIKNAPFRILMSHDPDHWDEQVLKHDFFDLTLSGHTHGMQFGIEKGNVRWSPAQYFQKRWAGMYSQNDRFLYVNRGLGYHGIPARVGMPPEITVIELKKGHLSSVFV
jgi:predicted MPP superfamily phosphohydrolase